MKKLKHFLATPIKNGYSPVCTDKPTSKVVLGLGALTGSGLNLTQVKWVPESNTQADKFPIESGDFLVSRSNTLDKVGRAALYRGGLSNCSYPDLMMKFRVDEGKIIPDFMELILQSAPARKHFMRCASGTSSTMAKITKSVVESLKVPEFSMQQQQSIVKTAREWDNAIEKTETLIEAKEKQFEWLLNNLIEDDFKSCKKTLSEYASIAKKEKILSADGEKLLTVKLHCKGIEPNTRDIKVVLSSKGRPYYQRLAGEFLIGRQNFHNGGFGIVPSELDGFIASNAITTLDLNQHKLMPEYLFFHFSRKNYYLRVGHIMDGTGQKELSDKQIMKLPILAPSIKVQQDIVLKLSSAKEEIKLLQALLDKYRSQKRGLMQKLLTGEWQVGSSQPVAEDMYQEASV
ncbi:restriction endonuclease subunit S [Photobacterium damselae]|uniref:restriction endonuclease subunit S n=1 Tax=Photobacterium damselae TaxID=38293 RepID=UPI002090699F|nr:restriction endonuclease subunit S [Photobacterium damselae]USR77196.1 restriction endonuclease subunit S [Photobacterium damselae]